VTQKPSYRHHTVNKAYLRRFAKESQLRRVPLDGEPHPVSVHDASVVKGFYITSVPGLQEDAYEKTLSSVEGQAETDVPRGLWSRLAWFGSGYGVDAVGSEFVLDRGAHPQR
jgi:hypothetical protein